PFYYDRFQTFDITVDPSTHTVTPKLVATTLLKNEQGQQFVGQSTAFTGADATKNLRLDPESIRVAKDGTYYISDEYGPVIYHFDQNGKQIGIIHVPDKFEITNPNPDTNTEIATNTIGRLANRGMEGLAITPDGKTLFGIMQNPLIQDNELNSKGKRV